MIETVFVSGRFISGVTNVNINLRNINPKKFTIKNFSYIASATTEVNIVADLIYAVRIQGLFNGIIMHFSPGLEYNILTPTDGRVSASYNGFPNLTYNTYGPVNGTFTIEILDIDGDRPSNAWINSGVMMTIEFNDE